MRLINCNTLCLEAFNNDEAAPPFAILSHCWGQDEIIYTDMSEEASAPEKIASSPRWMKISKACQMAVQRYNLPYIWIDTCCIDKRSSAELSEAINSMWDWYWRAEVCLAFLPDVELDGTDPDELTSLQSRWFSRGWTLQELIAPKKLDFFDNSWNWIGDRGSLSTKWTDDVCSVAQELLVDGGRDRLHEFNVATRLSWAARRETTRREDRVYSLLGIFGVNMPTLYGEGYKKAFLRLQAKIYKSTADQSIFAWRDNSQLDPTPRISSLSPWECKVYGDANKLCQPQVDGISDTIAYIDALRPWRVNNATNYRTWTTNTKPLETTHIFAPCLEYFDEKWLSQLIYSPSFCFDAKADLLDKAWRFCHPQPSRRYGPRTQMVLARIMTWVHRPSTGNAAFEVEYALYLAILPIQIRQPQNQSHGPPSSNRYVSIHLLECSLEPGTFRRVSPRDVYIVDMTPNIAGNYFPPDWASRPEVLQNVFRVSRGQEQEASELKKLTYLQQIIVPKIRDVILTPPTEADSRTSMSVLQLIERPHTTCVRLQWVFMETSHLAKDDFVVESDMHADKSGLKKTSLFHHVQPTSARRRRESKRFIAWYRQPDNHNMYDRKGEDSTIRILLRHKLSGEGVGVILTTRPANVERRRREGIDDEWGRSELEPSAQQSFTTRITLVSPKFYHSKKMPDLSTQPDQRLDSDSDTDFRVCNCPLSSTTIPSHNPAKTPLSPTFSFKTPFETIPGPNSSLDSDFADSTTCDRCSLPHISPSLDPCDAFLTLIFGRWRQPLTLAFVEPKRRLIDDPRVGPMLNVVVVLGKPEDWLKKVQEDEKNGVTAAVLGETLWKSVGKPPIFDELDPVETVRVHREKEEEVVMVGGWVTRASWTV